MAELRHLILVGLPGAGKSTVGPGLAVRLGRPFVDCDAELERRTGLAVPALFARDGEGAFRALEAELSIELAGAARPSVIAPGGGWVANAAATAPLRPLGRIIYLRVSPEAAVHRMGAAVATRPLLAGGDPVAAVRQLLDRRSRYYAAADLVLDTEALSPAETVDTLEGLVRELERV